MTDESHRALRQQLGAYVLDQLPDSERQTVRAHLEGCATCRSDLEEIAPVGDLLGSVRGRHSPELGADPAEQPDPQPLSPALIAQVRATPEGTPVVPHRPGGSRRYALVAAAAAVVLVAGGVGFGAGSVLRGSGPAPTGEPVAARVIDDQVQATARVVAHTWGLEVRLTATGFAPGRTFQVTVTDDSGRTVGAGEFVGTGTTEMRCNLNSSVLRDDASSFQVTDPDGRVVVVASL